MEGNRNRPASSIAERLLVPIDRLAGIGKVIGAQNQTLSRRGIHDIRQLDLAVTDPENGTKMFRDEDIIRRGQRDCSAGAACGQRHVVSCMFNERLAAEARDFRAELKISDRPVDVAYLDDLLRWMFGMSNQDAVIELSPAYLLDLVFCCLLYTSDAADD